MSEKEQHSAQTDTNVSHVLSTLEELKYTSRALPHLIATASSRDELNTIYSALETRRYYGLSVPFDLAKQYLTNDEYYAYNFNLISNLFHCGQITTSDYHRGYVLSTPEGRHASFPKMMRETMACIKMSGWDKDRSYVFNIISGLTKPQTDRDRLILQFAKMLNKPPQLPITRESIVQVYQELLLYVNAAHNESMSDQMMPDEQFLELIEGVTQKDSINRHHPVIQAIMLLQVTLILRPFPIGNAFMGRILFSWVSSSHGLPLLSLMPIVELLYDWSHGTTGTNPAIDVPMDSATIKHGNHVDWTLWLEIVIEHINDEMDIFTQKLFGLYLRRERMTYLFEKDQKFNSRQKEVLIEALLHTDAEFTYGDMMKRFGISYGSAYADLGALEEQGFLQSDLKGKTVIFTSCEDYREHVHQYLRETNPEEYSKFYTKQGKLTDSYIEQRKQRIRMMHNSLCPEGTCIDFIFPHHDADRCVALLNDFKN